MDRHENRTTLLFFTLQFALITTYWGFITAFLSDTTDATDTQWKDWSNCSVFAYTGAIGIFALPVLIRFHWVMYTPQLMLASLIGLVAALVISPDGRVDPDMDWSAQFVLSLTLLGLSFGLATVHLPTIYTVWSSRKTILKGRFYLFFCGCLAAYALGPLVGVYFNHNAVAHTSCAALLVGLSGGILELLRPQYLREPERVRPRKQRTRLAEPLLTGDW
jgi:hypothetical protein